MKKKGIKLLAALACLTLAFGFAACGDDDNKDNNGDNGGVASGSAWTEATTVADAAAALEAAGYAVEQIPTEDLPQEMLSVGVIGGFEATKTTDGTTEYIEGMLFDTADNAIAFMTMMGSDADEATQAGCWVYFTYTETDEGDGPSIDVGGNTVTVAEAEDTLKDSGYTTYVADEATLATLQEEGMTGAIGAISAVKAVDEMSHQKVMAVLFDTEANATAYMNTMIEFVSEVSGKQNGCWVYYVAKEDHVDEYDMHACSTCWYDMRDGSAAHPYAMSWNEDWTGWLPVTIEAGATTHYEVSKNTGAITITGATSAVWMESIYTPENGVITITFDKAEVGMTEVVAIVNAGDTAAEVTIAMKEVEEDATLPTLALGTPTNITLNEANNYSYMLDISALEAGDYIVTMSNYSGSHEMDVENDSTDEAADLGNYVSFTANGEEKLTIAEGYTLLSIYPWVSGAYEAEYTFTITLTAASDSEEDKGTAITVNQSATLALTDEFGDYVGTFALDNVAAGQYTVTITGVSAGMVFMYSMDADDDYDSNDEGLTINAATATSGVLNISEGYNAKLSISVGQTGGTAVETITITLTPVSSAE